MKKIRVPFIADPADRAAGYVAETGLSPSELLLVTPTQRFKTYFADAMLRRTGTGSCVLPRMATSKNLLQDLAAETGCQLANESERLLMLHRACAGSELLGAIVPSDALNDYRQFRVLAGTLLNSFHELAGEEIDVRALMRRAADAAGPGGGSPGSAAGENDLRGRRLHALCDLYLRYGQVQQERGVYDGCFLYPRVTGELVRRYTAPYRRVVLIAPLALTGFERRVYGEIDDRLVALYQDTDQYDFSSIMTMSDAAEAGDRGGGTGRGTPVSGGTGRAGPESVSGTGNGEPKVGRFEASSRVEEVMICQSLVRKALEEVEAHQVAVVNIDSLACEMLYDALQSAGIEVNISEGLPAARSALHRFLTLVRGFFSTGGETRFFLELIRNELFLDLCGGPEAGWSGTAREYRELKNRLVESRTFTVTLSSAPVRENPFLADALAVLRGLYRSGSFRELHESLLGIFSRLRSGRTYQYHAVRRLLLEAVLELIDLESGEERIPLGRNPFEVLLQQAASLRYPVLGSMRGGVQIVGLLETRGICFDTVLVPGFNEGFFPVQSNSDLFISVADRRNLGIGTFLEREELEFYYLKRIVDSSRRSFLLSLKGGGGEYDVPSRFGVLIGGTGLDAGDLELPVALQEGAAPPPGDRRDLPVLTGPVSSFSRMDIDRIKRCQVQYYIARVLGLPEPLEPAGEVEPQVIGKLVHHLFHRLYRDVDFERGAPSLEDLRDRFRELFGSVCREGLFPTREEVLTRAILENNLLACLRSDARRFAEGFMPLTGLMERELEAGIGGDGAGLVLRGRIDRVDRTPEGEYVVLDYKTGAIPDIKDHLEEREFAQVQLACYGLLFARTHPGAAVRALSYFDVNRYSTVVPVLQGEDVPGYLERFERHLVSLVRELHQGELDLARDQKNCAFCPYDMLCRIREP